jgi:hypothetical protein
MLPMRRRRRSACGKSSGGLAGKRSLSRRIPSGFVGRAQLVQAVKRFLNRQGGDEEPRECSMQVLPPMFAILRVEEFYEAFVEWMFLEMKNGVPKTSQLTFVLALAEKRVNDFVF